MKRYPQVVEIFEYLRELTYADKPNYQWIRQKLKEIYNMACRNWPSQ